MLRQLVGIATKAHKWSPSRTAAVISGVTTAVTVDMDIAISVYRDAMLTERQARQDKVNTAIDSFDEKMALALGPMSQSSEQMQSTASLLTNNTDQANRQASAVAAASEEASTGLSQEAQGPKSEVERFFAAVRAA